MAFLSLVTTVLDSSGERVDQPQDDGTYLPVAIKVGANLAASAAPLGGQTEITLDCIAAGLGSATPTSVSSSASAGVALTASRADHVHDLAWTAVTTAASNATSPLVVQSPWGVDADHIVLGGSTAPAGQVRAADGEILSYDIAGVGYKIVETSGTQITYGHLSGGSIHLVGNASSFDVQDVAGSRLLLSPLDTQIAAKVRLYGGAATAATSAGDIGLDATGRLTVFADGTQKTVLVTGDAGGGASLYPALGLTDLGYWGFTETSGNFANGGTAGVLPLIPSGTAPVYGQAQPLGVGIYSSIATRIESAVTSAIQPTTATLLLWIKPQYLSDVTTYTGVFGIADPTGTIPFAMVLATNTTPASGYRPQNVWYADVTTSAGTSILTMADGSGLPDYTGFEHNQWNLLAMTYDGTTLSAYVNGGLVNTMAVAGGNIDYSGAPNARIVAGGSAGAAAWRTIGRLGYLRIRSGVMSASDIRLAYRSAMAWA